MPAALVLVSLLVVLQAPAPIVQSVDLAVPFQPVSFRQGVVYGVKSLWAGARLVLHRRGIWRSKKFQA